MTIRFYLYAVLILFTTSTAAVELTKEGTEQLNSYLEESIATTPIPGMVALVVNKDGIIYQHAVGLMNSAEQKPMTEDAIFRLASMTKAITSTAAMLLVEEHQIDLDAPVSRYLPEFKDLKVFKTWNPKDNSYTSRRAKTEMTIRHLLTNTSGLGYGFTSDKISALSNGSFAVSATEFPLLFDPGSDWQYGESTRVLGRVIETVSRMELEEFLQIRLLRPLEMLDTTFDIPAGKNARVVTTHTLNGTQMTETPNPVGAISFPHNGDGGLAGTAKDYGQFIRLFLNDGWMPSSGRLLKEKTVELMAQNHTAPVTIKLMHSTNTFVSQDFPLGAGVDSHALGFQRTEQQVPGMRSVGSLSWAGIYNTEFWIDREQGIGAVLLMQYLPFYDAKAIEVLQGFEKRIYSNLKTD